MLDPEFFGWAVGVLSLGLALAGVFLLLLDQKIERYVASGRNDRLAVADAVSAAAEAGAAAEAARSVAADALRRHHRPVTPGLVP